MNCKPGDLAYVWNPAVKWVHLRFVAVIERAPTAGMVLLPDGGVSDTDVNCWIVQFSGAVLGKSLSGAEKLMSFGVAKDSSLRPIRDPGEDAQDETLAWLPVASKEAQPA